MNTKAIALFAVLAVALTGGFAIVGADAADGDDFTAEYTTDGLVYGVSATFDVALDPRIQWVGSIYDGDTPVKVNRNMAVNGNVLTTMWLRSALEAGDYTLVIFDNPKTVEYTGTFTVHEDPVVTFYVDDEPFGEPVTVLYGKTVEAPEMPVKVGYSFDGWYLSGELTPFDFTTPITEDTALYGSYVAIDYNVTLVDQDGKQIGETETANFGDKIEFEIVAPAGYEVVSVTSEPVIDDFVFDMETYEGSFTMPASDVTLTATFELIPVPYEAAVYLDEKIIADDFFLEGEDVSFDLSEHIGLGVTASVTGPEDVEFDFTDGVLSFEMPAKDVDFELVLTPIVLEYTITVDPEIEGGDVLPDTILAAEGATVTLSYTEDEGYTFISYYAYTESTETPIAVSDDGTFTMPAEDVIVGAIFLPDVPVEKYTVTVLPSENGKASADVTEAEEGDLITITATPDDGYQTVAIYLDGQPLEVVDDEAYFLMPAKDVEVSAVFAEIPVGGSTVTYVDEKGVIETVSYEIGEEVVYHVTTVPEGKRLGSVDFEPHMIPYIDHEACTVEFTAAEGNYTATISYIAPFTVYLVDQDGEPIGDFEYFAEDSVEIDMGMYLGVEVESATSEPEIEDLECEDGVITFTMPAEDVTVTVTLKPIVPETATVVFIDGITEEEVATETVIVGAYLTEIPNEPVHEGMTFTGWYREGSDVPYDFATMPVMENMTLYADYVETPVVEEYIITVYSKIENGSVTADKEKAQAGDTVTLTNTPAEGYVFNGYTVLTEAMMPVVVEDDGTFVMPAENVTVFADFQPETVITYTVSYVDQDGRTIATSEKYEEGDYVSFFIPPRTGADAVSVDTDPVIEDFDYDLELMTGAFTMPASDVTVTVTYEAFVPPETVDVTFYVGEEVYASQTVAVGECAVEPEDDPVLEGATFIGWYTVEGELFDFETPVTEDLDLYAEFKPFVAPVSVTFMDGETVIDIVFVEIGGFVEEVPEAPVKEGNNFVGWCVNDIPTAIDFSLLPIFDDMVVEATYVPTPDIGEGFAILYHDMYNGKPVDIWWKGYASKDDRVMLANGMDATAIFMGWLAEDQETLFAWNAAYDLNDIERNDCLIYPASYGYPGTDRIYELNAIYALEIEWVSFDGETVLKTDEVIRGDYLEAPFDDGEMQDLLDDYKPSDEGYSYSWAGWSIPGVGTYTSEDVEFIKANGSWRIVATYEGKVNEYDITFIWHDGTATIRVPYGEVPEIRDPPAYEDDDFTYTFAGWDPEVTEVTGDATYTATYDKTSKTKEVTVTVNDPVRGYFTYDGEEYIGYIVNVPMDFDVADIDEDVLTFDLLFYVLDVEIPETLVFTAVPNDDDFEANKHFEFVKWNVSEDGLTYTAEFTEDIITSKDLDRIQTFFDYTKTEGGDVVFTLKSKDGLAIPKGTMTVWYYEIAYLEDIEDWVQIERSCDAIAMDWDEETYGDNLISMTIEYADLTQDGEAFDITSKTISTMWLVFDGVNGAHCESNKATPGQ